MVLLGVGWAESAASPAPFLRRCPSSLSASATPASLSAGGGVVMVAGTVESATIASSSSCRPSRSRSSFRTTPEPARHGAFSAQVTVGPNTTPVQRTVAFALVASNSASTSMGRFYVLLAGAKPSPRSSPPGLRRPSSRPQAASWRLPPGSRTPPTCQLQLLSTQSFPVVYSHNAKACSTGTFSAEVTIGPNPTTVPRTVAFGLTASATSSHANDPVLHLRGRCSRSGQERRAHNDQPTFGGRQFGAARNYQELELVGVLNQLVGRSPW